MNDRLNRRQFVKTALAGIAATKFDSSAQPATTKKSTLPPRGIRRSEVIMAQDVG